MIVSSARESARHLITPPPIRGQQAARLPPILRISALNLAARAEFRHRKALAERIIPEIGADK